MITLIRKLCKTNDRKTGTTTKTYQFCIPDIRQKLEKTEG